MADTLTSDQHRTVSLPAYQILSVVASASGAGSLVRLGDQPGEASQGTVAIAASETKMIGPFAATSRHDVQCTEGSLTFEIVPADFPSVTSDMERVVKLTQTEYDALSPPDASTLYLITA
jgi:hypothetical protein